jgi:SNF2 family DNA or RNA helicase
MFKSANQSSHFLPSSLTCVRFHGQDRPGDPEALRSSDIVLTTYATVASDHAKKGLLCQMGWFRIVLDEGMNEGVSYLPIVANIGVAFDWESRILLT